MQPTSLVWKMLEFYGTRIKHRGKNRVHEWLRSALRAEANCDLEVERRYLRWQLNPSDFVQTHLYWTGEYEPWDLQELSRWVAPNAVFLDVGANFGYYSVCLAPLMKGSGQVFAFEPCHPTLERLKINIALNHLESIIKPVPCGLSDQPGSAYLDETDWNSGAATISVQSKGAKIMLDTLDNFCKSQKLDRLDLIKIDVEGSEFRVLQGGQSTIARFQPVLMIEFNSSALKNSGSSVKQLDAILRGWGYQLYTRTRKSLHPFQPDQDDLPVVNVFCFPPRCWPIRT